MATKEREIYDDLMKNAMDDEIEEIAYLMGVKTETLQSMFIPSNKGLIFECLMKASHFDLLTKYFSYDSSRNCHNLHQYSYIKPLRLLLFDLYGDITSLDDVTRLFADIGEEMAYPQYLLRSFSEVEHRLTPNGFSGFLKNLEKAVQRRSFSAKMQKQVKDVREKYEKSITEIDHRSQGSDVECGNALPNSGSAGRTAVTNSTKLEYYPIERTRFYGYCLIINNVTFENEIKYKTRTGSDKDADDLKRLFEDLDYEVVVKNNVTNEELKVFLTGLQRKDFTKINVLVVFVMSHGEKDLFVLSDGVKIEFETTFQNYFMPKHIPSLRGKPKLFFIQACQGTETFETFPMSDIETVLVQDCLETDSGTNSVPAEADFYFAVSTVPNYFSQRNVANGGWFIQSLVTVLKEHAKELDVHSIMTMVNNHLTQRRGNENQTQCANVRKMTLRRICFLGRPLSQLPL